MLGGAGQEHGRLGGAVHCAGVSSVSIFLSLLLSFAAQACTRINSHRLTSSRVID